MSGWSHLGASCEPEADAVWRYRPPASWGPDRARWLARRWGRLSEASALVPTIVGDAEGGLWVRAGAGGHAYAPSPLALARLTPLLGQLDRALRVCDLHLALTPGDLWLDGDGRAWLFGLAGLRRALGAPGLGDPATLLPALGGAADLESGLDAWRRDAWPHDLAAWRAAGEAGSCAALGARLPDWSEARRAGVTRCFPPSAGGLLVLGPGPEAPDALTRWALDPATDRLRVLAQPAHEGTNLAAVRARREAFASAHPDATPGPSLDLRLARASAPELRHAEPGALGPPPPLPRPELAPAPPSAPRLRVSKAEGGGAELSLEGAPAGIEAAVIVRCGARDPLVPEDGTLVAEVPVGALPYVDSEPAERYAVFPRVAGTLGPSARAAFWGGPEVGELSCEGGVGCVRVRWEAAPEALIEVYADGRLAHSAQGPGEWTHDCLDPDQRVVYRVCVSLPDGGRSPGAEATAVALGPPPALAELHAEGGNLSTTVRWSWPDGESYDRVLVERTPAFGEGPRTVRRSAEPELVDLEVDPGVRYVYSARAALGEVRAVHAREAEATPWAELEGAQAEPGGEAVCLRWSWPAGLDAERAEVVAVRSLEGPPADLEDGERLAGLGEGVHVDRPLAVGVRVHYRLALRLGDVTSHGVLLDAVPREPAGALGGLEVEGSQGALTLRVTPPQERCQALEVYTRSGAATWALMERIELAGPEPLERALPASPGAPTLVRVVPVHDGVADPAQALECAGTAWDDLADLRAPAVADRVELTWSPPAAPPAGYRVERSPVGGRDGEERSWSLAPDATRFEDAEVTPRQSYCYRVTCEWPGEADLRAHEVEVTALALPPELPKAELRAEPGAVVVRYLPVAPAARLHSSGAAVFLSARPPAQLREAWPGEDATFDLRDAADLGLTEVAVRPRSKKKELVRCAAPPPGELQTYVLASLNGDLARPVLIRPVLGLPEDFAELSSARESGATRLTWSWPESLRGAQITDLTLERGLQEVPAGLSGDELEDLSAPWSKPLPSGATSFEDVEAPSFLTWGYRLLATLAADGESFEVPGPRLVIPPTVGGTLSVSAHQPRGLFGSKQRVDLAVACPAPRWPAFDIVRVVGGQQAGKVVASFAGGSPQPKFVDDDLGAFSAGTRLRYRMELKRPTDRLGFEVSEAEVQLS